MNVQHRIRYSTQYAATSRGAALMVSLVMIFLLSVMGISSMRSASLEKQMVTNAMQSRDVFQAAESSNEIALNDFDNLMATFEAENQTLLVKTEVKQNIGLKSQSTLRYVGEGNATGASLNAMQGANSFDALYFIAQGVATVDSIRASRQIDQGANRIAPAN